MSAIAGAFWTQTFLKTSGAPYSGCRVFHYAAGTSTNLDVFTDAAMTTAAAQPVVGDNSGRVSFYASGTYRLLIKSSVADGDLALYDWDGVELVHHTATLRAEDRGTSNPAITAAHRGRLFATVDGGGDVLGLKVVKTASTFLDFITLPQLTQMLEFKKGADVASTTSVTLGTDGNFFDITGTTNIDSFSSKQGGTVIWTRFTGTGLNLTHNATSFIMPWGRNYRTVQNEIIEWVSLGAGNWVLVATNGPRNRIGDLVMQAGSAVPAGFLACDGAGVSRTTYTGLFAEIGTAYGVGDGATTFNVPDLRGRAPMGTGTGTGGGASGSGAPAGGAALNARVRGDWLGDERRPQHSHSITDPGHTHGLNQTIDGSAAAGTTIVKDGTASDVLTASATTGISGTNNDGSGLSENIQPVIIVPFNIRF